LSGDQQLTELGILGAKAHNCESRCLSHTAKRGSTIEGGPKRSGQQLTEPKMGANMRTWRVKVHGSNLTLEPEGHNMGGLAEKRRFYRNRIKGKISLQNQGAVT